MYIMLNLKKSIAKLDDLIDFLQLFNSLISLNVLSLKSFENFDSNSSILNSSS